VSGALKHLEFKLIRTERQIYVSKGDLHDILLGELRQLKQKQYPEGGQFNLISQNQPNGLSYLSTAEAIASPAMGLPHAIGRERAITVRSRSSVEGQA
jgi:hypothetical protein